MYITVITDCRDANAQARQETRYAELFPGTHVSFVGVSSDIEAAGNLVDVLDAAGEAEGIVAVNVAPRHGRAKEKWPNGTPFGYLWFRRTLVVCTIDGETLSLLKRLGMSDRVNVTDIREAMAYGGHDEKTADHAATSQFRSFDYLPRLARIVWDKKDVPCEVLPFSDVPDAGPGVWWIDSFGNCKTTLLPEDIQFEDGAKRQIVLNGLAIEAACFRQLRSVPDYYTGLIVGSSGYGDKRFVELVVQGGSAAKHYQVNQKDTFEITAA